MLRAFTFGDGTVRYRDRFLRTDAYAAAQRGEFEPGFANGGSSLFGRLRQFLFEDPYDNATVVVERARAPLPHALPFDFHGRFLTGVG